MQKNIKKPESIDSYLIGFPENQQVFMQKVRQIIAKNAPDATECISYGMPWFKFMGSFVWFASCKDHCGLYVIPEALNAFRERLIDLWYTLTKSAIHLPWKAKVPEKLIVEIVRYTVEFKKNNKK